MQQPFSPDIPSLVRYRDYLRSLARARLGASEVDASDVVQEALLRAHVARHQFRGETQEELAGWLRTILKNTLANAVRAKSRRGNDVALSLNEPSDSSSPCPKAGVVPVDGRPLPDEIVSRNEQLARLARALIRLPDDQRAVVEMRYLHGLKVGEIGELTGRSRPSVAGLLFRGVEALRNLLKEPDELAGPGRRERN